MRMQVRRELSTEIGFRDELVVLLMRNFIFDVVVMMDFSDAGKI